MVSASLKLFLQGLFAAKLIQPTATVRSVWWSKYPIVCIAYMGHPITNHELYVRFNGLYAPIPQERTSKFMNTCLFKHNMLEQIDSKGPPMDFTNISKLRPKLRTIRSNSNHYRAIKSGISSPLNNTIVFPFAPASPAFSPNSSNLPPCT